METFKKYVPLNLDLMANPVNWFIITFMVLFAGVGIALIVSNTTMQNGATK